MYKLVYKTARYYSIYDTDDGTLEDISLDTLSGLVQRGVVIEGISETTPPKSSMHASTKKFGAKWYKLDPVHVYVNYSRCNFNGFNIFHNCRIELNKRCGRKDKDFKLYMQDGSTLSGIANPRTFREDSDYGKKYGLVGEGVSLMLFNGVSTALPLEIFQSLLI